MYKCFNFNSDPDQNLWTWIAIRQSFVKQEQAFALWLSEQCKWTAKLFECKLIILHRYNTVAQHTLKTTSSNLLCYSCESFPLLGEGVDKCILGMVELRSAKIITRRGLVPIAYEIGAIKNFFFLSSSAQPVRHWTRCQSFCRQRRSKILTKCLFKWRGWQKSFPDDPGKEFA
jgi:hypothetical protein